MRCWSNFITLAFGVTVQLMTVSPAVGKPQAQRIPDEYESLGGHALGFANGGTAATSGLGSVRSNPAMLALEKQYSVSAGYHWPSVGREFYQAGAVDGKTSNVAAGVVYTSSQNDFKGYDARASNNDQFESFYDSPIKYRLAGGMAQSFNKLSIGVSGQYVEGFLPTAGNFNINNRNSLVKSATLGFGIAGLLTEGLRFGISGENLSNKKVRDLAPKTLRAGVAYSLFGGNLTLHCDYLQRDRVFHEKESLSIDIDAVELAEEQLEKPEQLVTGSASVRVQDLLRLLFATGQDLSGSGRRLIGGGIALVNQSYSLSYMISQPYTSDPSLHQAVNISMQVAI
ncbi:MAG: hypothetical protein AB8G05_07150 [Oligoflexales bacterium]